MLYKDAADALMATVPKLLNELADIAKRASTVFAGLIDKKNTDPFPGEFFKIDADDEEENNEKKAVNDDIKENASKTNMKIEAKKKTEENNDKPSTPPGIATLNIGSPK